MPFINEMNKSSSKDHLKENYDNAKKDSSFQALVKKLSLTEKEAIKLTSKLEDTILECRNCEACPGLFSCKNTLKGHIFLPEKKEGNLYFSYAPCKYQRQLLHAYKLKEEKALKNRNARMKDIDMTGDKKRMEAIKWIDRFCEEYEYSKEMKGLYLHGSFGSGKTFLISALFHELEVTKQASCRIVYFPEALRTLKDDWELYESKIHEYQKVDLLLLDDIGAEKVTEWGRDEVLGTILQYRMEHALPTFFTSNMNLQELESHLASVSKNVDLVKARRIIERIKQLAIPMELISENRRH